MKLKTVKPTEWEVWCKTLLDFQRLGGVTEGIHPPFRPYYLRKLNEDSTGQRPAHGVRPDNDH